MFYTTDSREQILTSSQHLFLTFTDSQLIISPERKKFVESLQFERSGNALYSNKGYDDRLMKVLPNHYLDLHSSSVLRYNIIHSGLKNEDKILEYTIELIKGTYKAVIKRYTPMQAITAGWETRTLLAGSKLFSKNIIYYVFKRPDTKLTSDVIISEKLAHR